MVWFGRSSIQLCQRASKLGYLAAIDILVVGGRSLTLIQGAEYLISGHSVGGALATLAAAFLVQSGYIEDPKKVKLVTFGQPRVGDKEFAENFDKMGIYDYRVVHWRDVVPALLLSGYWHHGKEVIDGFSNGIETRNSTLDFVQMLMFDVNLVTESWVTLYVRKQIFYDAGMMPGQFSTCEIGDSLNCSNTDLSTSDIDHQVYFGEVVSEYGKRGCKR
ncbi:triacylglycerol lipase [Ancylostoma caninum]|uniref:Triacylglycerol lipase n=1 Tax=Ancylostoma caninum TaxID=29170 RepID=A0A368H4U2_ANCCA|nr:triacylglycerol lipase [Ancylostoma caninum]